jgi:hypothetical protein
MNHHEDMNQRRLKRAVERNSYAVDPERVAGALIVRLVQESVAPRPTGGPTRSNGARAHLRQAA